MAHRSDSGSWILPAKRRDASARRVHGELERDELLRLLGFIVVGDGGPQETRAERRELRTSLAPSSQA